MLTAIAKPFGWLLMWLYEVIGNYGIAILVFALAVKLLLLPFTMKSKRSSVRMAALQPQMKELEKKHGANKQKYNEEVAKLYQEEKINPMGGCLWSLLPFPILLALYQAIRFPLTIMMRIPKEAIEAGGVIYEKLVELGFNMEMTGTTAAYGQIFQSQFITEHFSEFAHLVEQFPKLQPIHFSFLGMDLGQTPAFNILWKGDWSNMQAMWPQLFLFLIPVLAAVLTWLTSFVAKKFTPQQSTREGTDQASSTMKVMNFIMPLMTLWFGYMMPGAVGLYWLAGMVLGVVQEWWLGVKYAKMLITEQETRKAAIEARNAEMERKRQEAEARKAANAVMDNPNTSRKKQLQKLRQEALAKAAEYERRLLEEQGIEPEVEPSREGDRPFARGRAYDPTRYDWEPEPVSEEEIEEEISAAEAEPVLPEDTADTGADAADEEDMEEEEE